MSTKGPSNDDVERMIETLRFFLKNAVSIHHIRAFLDLHLLAGIEQSSKDFIKRITDDHPVEKYNIAEAAVKKYFADIGGSPASSSDVTPSFQPSIRLPRYFYESGSVVGFITGKLAQEIIGGNDRLLQCCALTNNLLALTALAGLVKDVYSIKGRFDPKYFALLPFKETPVGPDIIDETHDFSTLRTEIERCDRVFAACSSFSFVFGPLVGTRDNALTKRAMYEGLLRWKNDTLIKKKFVLAFQVQKIVPFSRLSDDGNYGMREHGLGCFAVMAPPNRDQLTSMYKAWCSNLSDAKPTEVPRLKWHEQHLSGKKAPSTALRDFQQAYKNPDANGDQPNLDRTWLDVAHRVELLIGLPGNYQASLETKILEDELKFANLLLESAASRYRYVARYVDNVAIVQMEARTSPAAPTKSIASPAKQP